MTADEWNSMYQVGTKVRYYPVADLPEHVETRTRSEAWTLASGHPVVAVEGRAGGVSLQHLLVGWRPQSSP
jgi:hypothetical protein